MKAFWCEEQLGVAAQLLMKLVFEAHQNSVYRDNVSTVVLQQSAIGSSDYTKAIAAALMTLGGLHAPLIQTYNLLQLSDLNALKMVVEAKLKSKEKVPGWGNSFHQGPDPVWQKVDKLITEEFPEFSQRLNVVTLALYDFGKRIYPNPSAYTAITALILGLPAELSPWLFVRGRLDGWSHLFLRNLNQ